MLTYLLDGAVVQINHHSHGIPGRIRIIPHEFNHAHVSSHFPRSDILAVIDTGRLETAAFDGRPAYRTVAHIKSDGTVQDSGYRTIGHIKPDGTVQDAAYRTIGHAKDIPLKWAAFYFFFRD